MSQLSPTGKAFLQAGGALVFFLLLQEMSPIRLSWWATGILVAPLVFCLHQLYKRQTKLEQEIHRTAEEAAGLHLRTMESLALAAEAKDTTTHSHLQRVRIYAMELGKRLNLSKSELEAVQAAALLHDIGKLGVPEHIISKPGKLTQDEFEKMKVHPVVGSEILERINFPYPVAPIVKAHHEKWDGSGYPYGLKGDDIPIGARIISIVDCFDALGSDRQYKKALPVDQAIALIELESGKAFDPALVDILKREYQALEEIVKQSNIERHSQLSTAKVFQAGMAPDAGFESHSESLGIDSVSSIASARHDAQNLFELQSDVGNALSLEDTLTLLCSRLGRLIESDSVAVYLLHKGVLVPAYASGDNFRNLISLRVKLGEGLVGWVAANEKAIVNGNPRVEPGYKESPDAPPMESAIAIPLIGLEEAIGVVALYSRKRNAFTPDHLRILLASSSRIALSLEKVVKREAAEFTDACDPLTKLPNARSLFVHLDQEVDHGRTEKGSVAVLACDIDGFKKINEEFGFEQGNLFLLRFAERIKKVCRPYEYVARMGGDEFVIVSPGLTPDEAEEKIRVLKRVAGEICREVCGVDLVSLSTGPAYYPVDGEDAESLLAEAERRMYAVKQEHYQPKSDATAPQSMYGSGVYAALWQKGSDTDQDATMAIRRKPRRLTKR